MSDGIHCAPVTLSKKLQHLVHLSQLQSNPNVVSINVVGLCEHCEQNPCDWAVYGHTIVDSVRSKHATVSMDECLSNKTFHNAAYTMYAGVKFGYLGKRNRRALPHCVMNGIRLNFPDPNKFYVGFVPTNED